MSSRLEGERVAVRGIFAGARVSRGHDWKWGNQDGELFVQILHHTCMHSTPHVQYIHECVVCVVVSMWVLFVCLNYIGGVSGLVLLVKGWHNGSKVSINRTLNCENGPTYTHNVTISLVS